MSDCPMCYGDNPAGCFHSTHGVPREAGAGGKWEAVDDNAPRGRRARVRLSGMHPEAVEVIAVSRTDSSARARRREAADGFLRGLDTDA